LTALRYANRAAIRLLGAQDAGDIIAFPSTSLRRIHERVRTRTRIVIE